MSLASKTKRADRTEGSECDRTRSEALPAEHEEGRSPVLTKPGLSSVHLIVGSVTGLGGCPEQASPSKMA